MSSRNGPPFNQTRADFHEVRVERVTEAGGEILRELLEANPGQTSFSVGALIRAINKKTEISNAAILMALETVDLDSRPFTDEDHTVEVYLDNGQHLIRPVVIEDRVA